MKEKSFLQKCDCGEIENEGIQYVYNFGIMLSQSLSVFLGGDPDESVSSRTGKAAAAGKWWFKNVQEPVINAMFADKNHCKDAIEPDEGCKEIWHWV